MAMFTGYQPKRGSSYRHPRYRRHGKQRVGFVSLAGILSILKISHEVQSSDYSGQTNKGE